MLGNGFALRCMTPSITRKQVIQPAPKDFYHQKGVQP
jgi:hypothetical protein